MVQTCSMATINEQNGSHLLKGNRQEREDQEESNIPNRRDGTEDTTQPSEREVDALHMA